MAAETFFDFRRSEKENDFRSLVVDGSSIALVPRVVQQVV